jgi:hypothetical protein
MHRERFAVKGLRLPEDHRMLKSASLEDLKEAESAYCHRHYPSSDGDADRRRTMEC